MATSSYIVTCRLRVLIKLTIDAWNFTWLLRIKYNYLFTSLSSSFRLSFGNRDWTCWRLLLFWLRTSCCSLSWTTWERRGKWVWLSGRVIHDTIITTCMYVYNQVRYPGWGMCIEVSKSGGHLQFSVSIQHTHLTRPKRWLLSGRAHPCIIDLEGYNIYHSSMIII